MELSNYTVNLGLDLCIVEEKHCTYSKFFNQLPGRVLGIILNLEGIDLY